MKYQLIFRQFDKSTQFLGEEMIGRIMSSVEKTVKQFDENYNYLFIDEVPSQFSTKKSIGFIIESQSITGLVTAMNSEIGSIALNGLWDFRFMLPFTIVDENSNGFKQI